MLTVTLLGRFGAGFGAQTVPLQDGSKAQELFVHLLLNHRRARTREEVAALLWADADPVHSRAYLRKALWQLQSALQPPSGSTGAPLLEVDGDWIGLRPDADLWLDVEVLEGAYARARGLSGAQLAHGEAAALRSAVDLYAGDLLPNRYQEWCLEERERLKHLYLCLLEKLIDYSESHADPEAGLSHGRTLLAHDPTREHVHRQLMRLHMHRGDRAGALRQYRQCVETLDAELGVPPMPETTALHDRIRRGDLVVATGGQAPVAPSSLREVAANLDHLQAVVNELRESLARAVRPDTPAL